LPVEILHGTRLIGRTRLQNQIHNLTTQSPAV